MVWLEDPLTGDVPHRGIVEEEDELIAQELAPQYAAKPELQWAAGAVPVKEPIVVFLVGQAACLLADAFFHSMQELGSISVPELVRVKSPLEEEYGTSHQPVHTSTIHGLAAAAPALMLVECPRELPQEQAVAWVQHVLAALQPAAAVAVSTMPAMSYRGPGSPADEDLVFSLQTAAAEAAAAGAGSSSGKLPPPLPEATLLGGLPAALLTECELQQLPAMLVAGVQMQQVADAQFLYVLGEAAAAALQCVSGDAAAAVLVRQQPRTQSLAALSAAADGVYRSSASSSIFS